MSFDGTVDDSPRRVTVGGSFESTVTFDPALSMAMVPAPRGGLIIALAADELIIGRFVNGRWKVLRRLNGDQTHQGRHSRLPAGEFTLQRVKLYRYR